MADIDLPRTQAVCPSEGVTIFSFTYFFNLLLTWDKLAFSIEYI